MHRVRMLMHFGVVPYMVFDGDYLPSKAATEVERARRREESKTKGLELYRLNKPSQAHLELQKAVDVTPEMAVQLIRELKKAGIQYVVAPYEADAQLVYLERQGIIQGVLSEDSDLLVFGAKRLLTKLDQYGDCIEINRADFTACREINLVGWSDAEFRRMAILSGCDYLASINRMGLKSAYRLVRKHKTIEKILRMLSFDGQYHVPTGYLEAFYKAELTFLHQRVFCPLKQDVVMMTELQANAKPEDLSFIGGEVETKVAIGVANGNLDPMTKLPIRIEDTAGITPKTPWINHRRNTINTCLNTKPVKPIESFFKPKRAPLVELDPNSFTPSPTQQRILRQASGSSWASRSAPARSQAHGPIAAMPSSGPQPALANRGPDTVTSVGAALTRSTPSKRRRLCIDASDSLNSETSGAPESGRSRFFAPSTTDHSPSMKKCKNNSIGKSGDITVWSDDSIEDVMAELTDMIDCPQPSRKGNMAIFKDDIQENKENDRCWGTQDDKIPTEDTQFSTVSRKTVKSGISSSTSVTSFAHSAPSVAAMDKHATAELKTLAQKYTYGPKTERTVFNRREMQSSKELRAGVNASQAISKPPIFRQRSMTPLERLGLGAMNRSRTCSAPFDSTVNGHEVIEERASNQNSTSVMKPVIGLRSAHSIEPDASTTKGSEDAVIPDSENETGSASEVEERVEPKIGLGRYAFTR